MAETRVKPPGKFNGKDLFDLQVLPILMQYRVRPQDENTVKLICQKIFIQGEKKAYYQLKVKSKEKGTILIQK